MGLPQRRSNCKFSASSPSTASNNNSGSEFGKSETNVVNFLYRLALSSLIHRASQSSYISVYRHSLHSTAEGLTYVIVRSGNLKSTPGCFLRPPLRFVMPQRAPWTTLLTLESCSLTLTEPHLRLLTTASVATPCPPSKALTKGISQEKSINSA
jgi:hypothetical protein